jgi:serine/threonine protein kinase
MVALGTISSVGVSSYTEYSDLLTCLGQIGKGAFATVYQLATKMEGKLLAAKELEKRRFMKNGQLDKKIDNEMKIMEDLKHPNIVEFVEHHEEEGYLYIIMEYVRHGDLQGYLARHGRLKEEQAKVMAQQILSALNYLHRKNITHRDIKPDNILISEMDPLKVKLSDFGLSKVVQNDETFLKTFCGTLLYCAPEVFPDFDGKPSKGTKRRRGAKKQYHSYSSSVDIWSFAGVLWFSLCGKPPFEGIADATGQAMYNNIMNTRLDPTPLQQAGVSQACIDLLLQMLDTDPSNRPTDRECLLHPWLRDGAVIPQDPTLESIVEEDEATAEAGSNLSQLSIDKEISESDEDMDDEVLEDEEFERLVSARSKKVRTDPLFPRNQFRDNEHDSSADQSFQSDLYVESPNAIEESFRPTSRPLRQPRLFGEIGQSALESSGVLSAHANDALSQDGSSEVVLDDHVPNNVTTTSYHGARGPRQTPPAARARVQLDGGLTSPSLLGAEALVGELNMASPQSFGSVAHSENEPATPKTPDVPQHNSLENHSQHPSQFSDSTPKAKPPAFNRQISLPKTPSYYFDPSDPSTHTLEYASKVSGFDYVNAAEGTKTSGAQLPDTMRFSAQTSGAAPSLPSHRPSAEPTDGDVTSEIDSEAQYLAKDILPSLPPELDIKPPPRRLGKLTATSDSFAPNLVLHIDRSRTSWGRLPSNTLIYESSRDTRIPKTAFNIFWYSPNTSSFTVQELSQQGRDWTSLEGLRVGIFTCASNGISINGKHLRQKDDTGRALYGHLHNGDIVQVYHSADGTERLKFKCEFYQGLGKEPRKAGSSFNIQVGNILPT